MFEGEGREDKLIVLSPCCSSHNSLQLSADRQNAVPTDWMWHISLVIMRINDFPTGKPRPCVRNLGRTRTGATTAPIISALPKPVSRAWRVVTLGNIALRWAQAELQPCQPKMAGYKIENVSSMPKKHGISDAILSALFL